MEAKSSPPILSESDFADIQFFCNVAMASGAYLSLREALLLLQPGLTEQEFREALENSGKSLGRFKLTSGLITPKTGDLREALKEEFRDEQRRLRAMRNLDQARNFATFNASSFVRSLSVSGSVSYGSANESDDVDFFVITKRETLWLFLTKALILARVFRLIRRDSPSLCFSYMMDEDYAEEAFKKTRDELFARDALSATTILGSEYYENLLRTNRWLSSTYPRLYMSRVRDTGIISTQNSSKGASPIIAASNAFLYRLVGRYIRLKAYLGNRRLTRGKRYTSLFRARIGSDYCIYESARYDELRRAYRQLGRLKKIEADRAVP